MEDNGKPPVPGRSLRERWRNFFSGFRKALSANWDLKLVSVLLSSAFFLIVHARIGHFEKFTVPVMVSLNYRGTVVSSVSPSEVSVVLKGSQEDLRNFDEREIFASVNLQGDRESGSTETVTLRRINIKRPGRLSVERIEPNHVTVTFDNEVSRTMPLALPEIIGNPLRGFAEVSFGSVSNVVVKGSEMRIGKLAEEGVLLPVSPVNVRGMSQPFVRRVEVIPPADSGIISVSPPVVDVFVDIKTSSSDLGVADTNAPPEEVR